MQTRARDAPRPKRLDARTTATTEEMEHQQPLPAGRRGGRRVRGGGNSSTDNSKQRQRRAAATAALDFAREARRRVPARDDERSPRRAGRREPRRGRPASRPGQRTGRRPWTRPRSSACPSSGRPRRTSQRTKNRGARLPRGPGGRRPGREAPAAAYSTRNVQWLRTAPAELPLRTKIGGRGPRRRGASAWRGACRGHRRELNRLHARAAPPDAAAIGVCGPTEGDPSRRY